MTAGKGSRPADGGRRRRRREVNKWEASPKMKCIVLQGLSQAAPRPPPSSSALMSGFLRPANPPGVESKSREDPSALAKKPCWLVYKRARRIRKLNHLWLLMPRPTDRHEILLVATAARSSLSNSLTLSLSLPPSGWWKALHFLFNTKARVNLLVSMISLLPAGDRFNSATWRRRRL